MSIINGEENKSEERGREEKEREEGRRRRGEKGREGPGLRRCKREEESTKETEKEQPMGNKKSKSLACCAKLGLR